MLCLRSSTSVWGYGVVPKWEPRACMCIYVGRSPSHTSNVALILNPRSGHVSPQFHIVFGDDFTMVPHIFTLARSHRIGQTLYGPLPRFRCILKSKLEPGNQFQTLKQSKETSQAKSTSIHFKSRL